MHRFFVDTEINQDHVEITGAEAHHICHVLRLKPGDRIEIFNSNGESCSAIITAIYRRSVFCQVVTRGDDAPCPGSGIRLALAVLKAKNMDFVIQKATELGVDAVHPVVTEYSRRLAKLEKSVQRWHRVMISGCKQCRRNHPMRIYRPVPLSSLSLPDHTIKIMLWEKECRHSLVLPQPWRQENQLCLLVGPEGGFSTKDLQIAQSLGFQPVSLGNTILRAETAALAALSIILFQKGMLGSLTVPSLGP